METEFNRSAEGIYRDKDVLKCKYENLKKRTKDKHAQDKLKNSCYLNASDISRMLSIAEEFCENIESRDD